MSGEKFCCHNWEWGEEVPVISSAKERNVAKSQMHIIAHNTSNVKGRHCETFLHIKNSGLCFILKMIIEF